MPCVRGGWWGDARAVGLGRMGVVRGCLLGSLLSPPATHSHRKSTMLAVGSSLEQNRFFFFFFNQHYLVYEPAKFMVLNGVLEFGPRSQTKTFSPKNDPGRRPLAGIFKDLPCGGPVQETSHGKLYK